MTKWIILALIFSSFTIKAQESLYLEGAGHGGIGSINFEGPIKKWDKLSLHYRMGMSFVPIDANNGVNFIFPLLIGGLYGEKNMKFEFGLGQTPAVTTQGAFYSRLPILTGVRFDNPEKLLYYKIAYTPIVNYITDRQWLHWFGAGIGLKLEKL